MDAGAWLLRNYKKHVGVYEPDDILRFRYAGDPDAEATKPPVKYDIVTVLEKRPYNRYLVAGERPSHHWSGDRFVTFEIDGRDWERFVPQKPAATTERVPASAELQKQRDDELNEMLRWLQY